MINQIYDKDNWNCTHEVSQWYESHNLCKDLKSVSYDKWDTSFVLWMRRRFDIIPEKEQGCLVVMTAKHFGEGLHVGVWDDGMIHHCCPKAGRTVRSPLAIVNLFYKNIFYARLKNV